LASNCSRVNDEARVMDWPKGKLESVNAAPRPYLAVLLGCHPNNEVFTFCPGKTKTDGKWEPLNTCALQHSA
ncbi:MAG TPA: hypothetical protein PKX50_03915, partial [Thermomonas sp.]|nr:hypothetical protein [Thermomonas sp.]